MRNADLPKFIMDHMLYVTERECTAQLVRVEARFSALDTPALDADLVAPWEDARRRAVAAGGQMLEELDAIQLHVEKCTASTRRVCATKTSPTW